MPRKKLGSTITVLRLRPDDEDDVNEAAIWERKVHAEIERLSRNRLKLIPRGTGVEVGFIEGVDLGNQVDDLDFAVELGGKTIGWIDVTASNWTFAASQIMPVNAYKGRIIKKLKVPTWIIFVMKREPGELADRCVWIRGRDVIKAPCEWRILKGKWQFNHMTDKKDWHRGLKALVSELLQTGVFHMSTDT